MRHDAAAGGNVPTLTGADLLATVPELDEIADVVAIDHGLTPASHFQFPALFEIQRSVADALARDDVDGAVVVQGTDAIEETAFFFDLLHAGPKPRRRHRRDALRQPARLRRAARTSPTRSGSRRRRTPAAADLGAVVVLDGLDRARGRRDEDPRLGLRHVPEPRTSGRSGGWRTGGCVLDRARGPRRHVAATRAAERVYLVTATVATDGTPIDALHAAGADGFVVAATGAGNTDPALLAAAAAAMADGLPVVLVDPLPGRRRADRLRVPRRRRHVAAGRRAARRPPRPARRRGSRWRSAWARAWIATGWRRSSPIRSRSTTRIGSGRRAVATATADPAPDRRTA